MKEKVTHTRYFVNPTTGDGLATQPHPVALEEVGEHIKNWLGRFAHQGYYSGVGCRIELDKIGFNLEPVECGKDGEPWDWNHCALCDAELDSHGDCSWKDCRTHSEEYTGTPSGVPSAVAGVIVVGPEELCEMLRKEERKRIVPPSGGEDTAADYRARLRSDNLCGFETLRAELEAATGQPYSDEAVQAHIDAAGGFKDKLSEEEIRFIGERESDNAKIEAQQERAEEND